MPAQPKDELLTSRQAADRLGVKPETLYAYVARGLLRSERAAGGAAGRRYSAQELDAFVARRRGRRDPEAAAAGALFWGMPVVESAISFTDGAHLFYRGVDAVALAERASFEQAAALLWSRDLPAASPEWPRAEAGAIAGAVRATRDLASTARPIEAMHLLVASLAQGDDARFDTSARSVEATARRILPRVIAAIAAVRGGVVDVASHGPIGARVVAALGGAPPIDDRAARMVDRALVLSAEHELNASTFAARVAASTGADPYSVVCAAVATLGGPKHAGATERIEALVRETGEASSAARTLTARVARGDGIPGFGHPLYPGGDPRTPPLLDAARKAPLRRAGPRATDLEILLALVDAMAAQDRPPPTIDVGLVATAYALGLPPGSASLLVAFGRTAGWIAHAIEQYAMDELIRPRARYVGPMPEAT